MNEFNRAHPIVNFIYFGFVIFFAVVLQNPLFVLTAFLCALIYSFMLKEGIKKYIVFIMLAAMIVNPMFNHRGMTIIAYLPDNNPLTLESVLFGCAAAFMSAAVILWFSCVNKVMGGDKIIYLFGRISPSLALILSMSLSFVPKLKTRLNAIISAQELITEGKIKRGISAFSALVSWSLESSVITAAAMKSRGYGTKKRTSFSVYKMTLRDIFLIIYILVFSLYTIFGMGAVRFSYYPKLSVPHFSAYYISVIISYFLLCAMPIIIEIGENIKWNCSLSKI